MGGAGIPFHAGAKAWVDIGAIFGDPEYFNGAADVYHVYFSKFVDKFFGFFAEVGSTCDDTNFFSFFVEAFADIF